jgi:hypothetical protein
MKAVIDSRRARRPKYEVVERRNLSCNPASMDVRDERDDYKDNKQIRFLIDEEAHFSSRHDTTNVPFS